jgi:murein DD-endopeptidase MepM/ murein hydrolase activator NlpD
VPSLLGLDVLAEATSIGPVHETAGLPGYPARDFFAPAGSAAFSPYQGRVVKVSGHDPRSGPVAGVHGPFGWSVYIKHRNCVVYITHLGTLTVSEGQELKRGQKIGTVGNYGKWGGVDHLHVGLHRV